MFHVVLRYSGGWLLKRKGKKKKWRVGWPPTKLCVPRRTPASYWRQLSWEGDTSIPSFAQGTCSPTNDKNRTYYFWWKIEVKDRTKKEENHLVQLGELWVSSPTRFSSRLKGNLVYHILLSLVFTHFNTRQFHHSQWRRKTNKDYVIFEATSFFSPSSFHQSLFPFLFPNGSFPWWDWNWGLCLQRGQRCLLLSMPMRWPLRDIKGFSYFLFFFFFLFFLVSNSTLTFFGESRRTLPMGRILHTVPVAPWSCVSSMILFVFHSFDFFLARK